MNYSKLRGNFVQRDNIRIIKVGLLLVHEGNLPNLKLIALLAQKIIYIIIYTIRIPSIGLLLKIKESLIKK